MTPETPLRPSYDSRALRRARRVDRVAAVVIALGGIGVIASVAGILVFIAAEAAPLFREARVSGSAQVVGAGAWEAPGRSALGIDDHGRQVYRIGVDARVRAWRTDNGQLVHEAPVPGLESAVVTVTTRGAAGDVIAVGTADGRAIAVRLHSPPALAPQASSGPPFEVSPVALVTLDERRGPLRDVSARESGGHVTVAGLLEDGSVRAWWRDPSGGEHAAELQGQRGERFTTVSVGRPAEVAAGTVSGRVLVWRIGPGGPGQASAFTVGTHAVSALGWILGDRTLIVGDAGGGVSGWFDAWMPDRPDELAKVQARRFTTHAAAVEAVVVSGLDRSFVTAAGDGSVLWHHATSGVSAALQAPRAGGVRAAAFVPRADAVLVDGPDARIARYVLDNPHPEATAATLFGRVAYEGYPRPAFVWQSTGASDEFEPKLSLVPLVSGTLKAACYALLFAVPLALLGALYTSQFAHPVVRSRLKPAVEFMAALPTVVVGLIAGLWLTAFVERHLASVLLGMPLAMAAGTVGGLAWTRLRPRVARGRVRAGTELLVIAPMVLLGVAAAWAVGPWVEGLLFGGDLRLWLDDGLGFTFDQRNGLVIGLSMGFAVIPVVYTIADDAFASVPGRLTAASAALGASPWQTAWRVVVPTAGAGIVSAVMVGFGRAVGETMIVLMVSGNTPLMDWSIFNGLRTLAANIAIEAPEAPAGGTLYRVLFLSAALLFALTFVANTVADVLRQRLRDRYKAL